MKVLVGLDIGGTKCAVSIGVPSENTINIKCKEKFPTPEQPSETIQLMMDTLDKLLVKHDLVNNVAAIGISCGGPLNSKEGVILSPPNLKNWNRVKIVQIFKRKYTVPVGLQNDANACALAEWKWGNGRGCQNLVFLTFGTGMGAGLILNGNLYEGKNDMAGEVGHIRLANEGPIGFGKMGSFEGFCSGGGIAQLAKAHAEKLISDGNPAKYCQTFEDVGLITAERVGTFAKQGDHEAINIFHKVGEYLGLGLSIIIDMLNPDKIILGSIYLRQSELLEPSMRKVVSKEALELSASSCKIEPAGLGERIGDYASLSVALNLLERDHGYAK
ncbi:ROK family protein [Bacillus sp. T33-2]|uniref:ROK family protein n=1 Tax=Bacillus sp. T33-2 TaxID=2054168 RepID=UPI000C76BC2F|nr:ROK family protein [Bacillus sp. T33-2]PLR94683.1 sugar kinase [Bacillus sp. T33-2]